MATVNRLSNTGIMYTSGEIDEVTNNLAAQGSILFNGTTQYLTVPVSSAFTFGTGNFTIECWVYPTSAPIASPAASTVKAIYGYRNGADTLPYLVWAYIGGVKFGGDVTDYLVSNVQLTLNVWTHIAVVRIGTAMTMYINGVSVATNPSVSQNFSDAANVRYIGTLNGLNGYYWPGYISNLRVVKDVAVYTGAFTTPSQPLQKTQPAGTNIAAITNSANTSLLLSTLYNDAFKDLSDNNFTVSPTASPTSTVLHPFNPNIYTSVLFNGTSSYITAPYNVNQTLGTNNFTIEAWIYPKAVGSQQWIVSSWYGVGGQIIFYYNASNRLVFHYVTTGNVQFDLIGTTTSIVANVWQHIAVVRNGATITLYVNGIADATTSTPPNPLVYYGNTPKDMIVGRDNGAASNYFNGYMYNFRLVNGTAVYTSEFIPPTVPLTNITNTQLLLFLSKTSALVDNSSYNSGAALTLTNTASLFPGQSMSTNPIPISYANTGLAISKQYSNGALQTVNSLDEVSLNTNLNGSVSFTATSTQLLSLPSSGGYGLDTGDFTIEFWGYWTVVGASAPGNVITTNINTTGLSIYVTQSSLQLAKLNVGADLSVSVAQVTGKWDHYAFVRISGTAYTYKNGVLIGSGAVATNYAQNGLTIGTDLNRSGYTTGYLSNVRIVKGIGVYTGAFTPPTGPLNTLQPAAANTVALTSASSTSLLLRTLKTNVYDDSIYNAVITKLPAATPPPSTKQSPFLPSTVGYFSGLFNGSSQYLTTTANSLTSQNFTIECWFYLTSNLTYVFPETNYGGTLFAGTSSGAIWFYLGSASGSVPSAVAFAALGNAALPSIVANGLTIPINAWHHVAISRVGSTFAIWFNGVKQSITTSGTLSSPYVAGAITVGYNSQVGSYNAYFPGYISNARIVRGNAVYDPAGGNITVPTSPLTAVANTYLLTCQSSLFIDNSPNAFTVTATGATISNSITPFDSILSNTAPTIVANTTVRKQYSNGAIQTINKFDEYTSIA